MLPPSVLRYLSFGVLSPFLRCSVTVQRRGHTTIRRRGPVVGRFRTVAVAVLVIGSGLASVSGPWRARTGHASRVDSMAMAGNHMPMLTADSPDSFTPKAAA